MARSRGGNSIRYWRAEIGRRQIQIVRDRVHHELVRRRLECNKRVAGPADYEGLRQLELRLAGLDQSRSDLDRIPVKKKRIVDRFILRLWAFAVRGRFDFDE